MKVSICVTVLDEEKTISRLLESVLNQTKKPDEIVIVDGGSTDRTVQIIRHWQKKFGRIKVITEKCSRARGRNLAVEMARNSVIAMTDAGCVADKNWLRRITAPFENKKVDIVAGFYKMISKDPLQKAFSVFLGVHEKDFDITFLPSTRSIAFRKNLWERIGGFPEDLDDTAEDTVFNYKALKEQANFARVKNARVEWAMPESLEQGIKKMYFYAKGDAKSRIWKHPAKNFTSHNIKALSIVFRYSIGLILLIMSVKNPMILVILLILVILYLSWSFRKVFFRTNDFKAGLWGTIIQILSDFAVMGGFARGILSKK